MLTLLLACAAPSRPDVLLVSLDTTRADVIDAETTPNLWALAMRGARFTAAYAHAPTTLSSHSSVWTGLDPHGHAVPRNGYPLATDVPVLPARMASAGYETMGVIGASALARPMGIDRGFARWDEKLDHKHEKRHEARAAEVTDRALALLAQRRDGPVFLFAHYYDAHAPWQAPEPYAKRWSTPGYTGTFNGSRQSMQAIAAASRAGTVDAADLAEARARYRGEVSYIDAELGRLLAALENPYVVVFADHGEGLGDIAGRPWGHGPDVDPQATHVPLIVAGPGVPAVTIDAPVALSDVGATVLALAGVRGGVGQGRDLSTLWTGGALATRPLFLEATQPKQAERGVGWNNLLLERGVIQGGTLLVTAPWLGEAPRLLDRVGGAPVADEAALAELGALLQAWDAAAPPFREDVADEATREGLRALGYVE